MALRDKEEIIARVEELAAGLAEASGLELVEVEFSRPQRGRAILRLFLDREGGITLDEITRFSRVISEVLDVHDVIGPSYNLEVSSPGLTRALKKPRDFERAVGRLVRVTTHGPVQGRQVHRGTLTGLENDELSLQEETGPVKIPLAEVAKARLDF